MYSGEESSGDALNSAAGQFGNFFSSTTCNNMTTQEQVDWAALAQQWIQMKESTSFVPPPPAGMPSISYEEKGEEDMEVVKEDDSSFNSGGQELPNNPNPIYRSPPEWQPSWSDQSQWRPGWNNWPNGSSHSINVSEINAPPAPSMTILKGTAAIVNNKPPSSESSVDSTTTMDAAKRKTLPAWIREGLEKMEKEKLKQLEKQKEIEPKNAIDLINKELNVSPERLSNDIIKIKSDKSFQESDQSDEDDDDAIESPPVIQEIIQATSNDKPIAVIKSREEWLEEWMLIVRRSLTEVLLEVTNEEILNVAQETLKKNKIKASSAQVFRKSAISSITGKLGLGAYADSASENSESEDENDEDDSEQDSEEEIKESIRNRQIAFKSVAQEIELSAMEADLREQRRNAEHAAEQLETKTTKKGYDKDTGETQPDKKSQSNGKRSRERTSRFSDAKDLKHRNSTYAIIHTAALPNSSSEFDKRKTSNSTIASTTTTNNTASSSSRIKNYSDSSGSTSSSSDSYRRRKYRRTRDRNHKSSSSRRETSRASSDSDDYSRRSKKYRSSYSRDRSRSRSRSRSYTGKSRY